MPQAVVRLRYRVCIIDIIDRPPMLYYNLYCVSGERS